MQRSKKYQLDSAKKKNSAKKYQLELSKKKKRSTNWKVQAFIEKIKKLVEKYKLGGLFDNDIKDLWQ